MNDKPDIGFDHDGDYIKHREFGKGVTYEQDGVLFSSGYEAIKILKTKKKKDSFDNMSADELREQLRINNVAPPKVKTRNTQTIKAKRGHQSTEDKLAGFKSDDQPDHVRAALSENHAATMADQQAE